MQILRGMTWDHPRGLDSVLLSNSILQSELNLTVDWRARSLLDFGDQPVLEFFNDVDLMVIDHPHVPDAVHSNTVLPFENFLTPPELELLSRTSVGQSHNSYTYQGKQWALAIDTAAQVSAFRADLTDCAPVFWSDVIEVAKKGTLLWSHKPVDIFSTFATLMAQKGSPLCGDGQFINESVALEVLEFMLELSTLVPDFCASSNPIDVAEILATSDDYHVGVCMYGYSNYARVGFRERVLLYDDLPSFDGRASGSQLGGAGIAISAASVNPELAARVAMFLSMPLIQSTTYVQAGGQPGNVCAWKSESANSLTHNFFRNTLRTLERAWVRPRLFGWPDVQYESSQIIHQGITTRKITTATVKSLSEVYERLIRE